jgi:hypothetical protein
MINYFKILLNLVTNSPYTVWTLVLSIYIGLCAYHKSQKSNSIIIFTAYIFNISLVLILKFLQLIVFDNVIIFILEIMLGLFIIAYVIQKTEYHRKDSLLLLLLKFFSILLLILFFNETLILSPAVLKKNDIISENKGIVKINTPNIELPPSDEFPADKSGTFDKQLDLNRLKEFFEIAKVNSVDILEKKLKLEAIKANAEALALHERNKLISIFEEVFRDEGRLYQQNKFPVLGRLFKYISTDIFGLHLIPRVTWLSPAEIAAAGAAAAAAKLALDLAQELAEAAALAGQLATATAAAAEAAAAAGQAKAAAETATQAVAQATAESLITQEILPPEFTENGFLDAANLQNKIDYKSFTESQILELRETALQETRQQLETLNQLQETKRTLNITNEDLKRFIEEVEESRKTSDKSKEAVRKVKEENEKTRNEQAKAAKKSHNKKHSTTSPQGTQPQPSHGTVSEDPEAATTAQQVADHEQQNLESTAARKKQLLEELENKRSEDEEDLNKKKKAAYDGKQAQKSAEKAVEEAQKAADNINLTKATEAAIAKKKMVDELNARAELARQSKQNEVDLAKRLSEAQETYDKADAILLQDISTIESDYRKEVTKRNKLIYPNWIKEDEDRMWDTHAAMLLTFKGIPERVKAMDARLAEDKGKATEMFWFAEINSTPKVTTPVRSSGLFEYLRSLGQMNTFSESQSFANGTTAVVAPVAVVAVPPETQAGQDGGAAGVGYASPHGAYESKGK